MGSPLKNMFDRDTLYKFALRIKKAYSNFPTDKFIKDIFNDSWEHLELKARIRRIAITMGSCLPRKYQRALLILDAVADTYSPSQNNLLLLCFPDFVEVFGLDEKDWDISVAALGRYTPLASSEFAVRPFIEKDPERMMKQMTAWAQDESADLRRLASEGCRPLLPWSRPLINFKEDPTPVLEILEVLKADPSLYVRKSVANNLNDISKDHPAMVLSVARGWYGRDPRTDWIVKRGLRTLLKRGDPAALKLIGLNQEAVEVSGLSLNSDSLAIGDSLSFHFTVAAYETCRVRIDYGIDFVKKSGRRNRKIFRLFEGEIEGGQAKRLFKRHSFADLSTRQHWPGRHTLAILIGGTERALLDFELLSPIEAAQ